MSLNNNNPSNNTNTPNTSSSSSTSSNNLPPPPSLVMNGPMDDPMVMMQMIQQCMQLNNANPNQNSPNIQNVDPMMMMKMLQMFGGMQPPQPHVSSMLLNPLPSSSSTTNNSTSASSKQSPNAQQRSPSPPPRPSSPTIIEQDDEASIPADILLAQKYNLVEKKKRKMRCGKKRGPQEEFIFHLKLEQDKKKKRRNKLMGNTGSTQQQQPTTSSSTSLPNTASTTSVSNTKTSSSETSKQKKSSSASLGGTELKTKQKKTTKKIEATKRSKSTEDAEAMAKSSASNTGASTESITAPISSSTSSLSSIPISMGSNNFINNIPSDLLMPKLTPSTNVNSTITPTPSAGNFLSEELDYSSWQDVPQFPEFSNPYPPLQQKPKGCFYGDKSKGKKVHKVPINQSSSRLQIINNRKKNSVIGSIIDILGDDKAIINHTIPSMVTLLDGFIVKVNEAMKDMLGFSNVGELEFQAMAQNFLHPQDIIKHDILLLQMLSTNTDSCKHPIRFVNRIGKCLLLTTEFCCIRNELGLPQWIVIRLSQPNIKMPSTEEYIPHSQLEFLRPDYDLNVITRESLLQDSSFTFQQMFLKILERLFGSKQPTCFYDRNAVILWNNEQFDSLFNATRKSFFGRRLYDIPEMKGTIMEILANTVLLDLPDKLEAQMSPDSSQFINSNLKMNCYGQKVTENNGSVFGYVWMFSIFQEESTAMTPTQEETAVAMTPQPLPSETFGSPGAEDNMFDNVSNSDSFFEGWYNKKTDK
ncbi:hypothetical protein C9374_011900 [Naegleria lovaniensis]|uniref:PAS domain-containing protein n=1 Tax=Naegleria lovaniensis TaxID=51637 RepID=A0AA88KEX8_NAELO|nr:uncharacterized protein C9374_011900 [Naegleria lovaniensis]KAG2373611.1 hypothetical protein C9374_011900 [Naegleria lovaniensis]